MAQQKVTFESNVDGSVVTLVLSIDSPGTVDGEAMARIQTVMSREVERAAQIAAVNLKDQETNRLEQQRLRNVPAERPQIVAAAGSKNPDMVKTFFKNEEISSPADLPAEFQPNPGPQPAPSNRRVPPTRPQGRS